MGYYNYHSKIKRLVTDGKLLSYYFDSEYKNIGFAMVLCCDGKKYPIREHHFEEYFDLIGKFYITKKSGEIYETTFIS